MMHFTVEADSPAAQGCNTCCCEKMSLKPGTTTKVTVNYVPWALPIGWLHCSPSFNIEPMDTCITPLPSNNLPPAISSADGMAKFQTDMNIKLVEDLKTRVTDVDGDPITFRILPLYAPKHGKIVLDPNGRFEYTPTQNWFGEERFYASASDGKNAPFIFEVMIAVGIDPAPMAAQPNIAIGPASVDQKHFTVSFPVTLSPAAQECEIWRLTVLQGALDCDCQCYTRTDCFDIGVRTC
jgi:hypothetical protein